MNDFQPVRVTTSVPVATASQSTLLGMMTSLEVGSLDSSLSDFQLELIAMDTIVFGNSLKSIGAYIKKFSERIKRAQRFARTDNGNKGGTIDVQFVLDQKGDLISVKVNQSSGSKNLDQMALAVVQSAFPFSKLPDDYNHNELSLILPIIFQMQAN